MPDVDTFSQLNRSGTGWPQIWCRAATQLLVNPVPATAFLTRMILYGTKQNAALSGATDRWEMNPKWHPAGVDWATGLTMAALGRDASADLWLARAEKKVTRTVNLSGLARRKDSNRISVSTSPEAR
jgi:hypothetical protein